MRLDKTAYYSTVHGEEPMGIRFVQNGFPFDAHGQLVEKALTPDQKAKLTKAKKTAKADGEGEGGQGSQGNETAPVVSLDKQVIEGDVNLTMWLLGEAKYVPAQILAAVKKRYGVAVTTLVDAARLLVLDEKIVPEAECKVPFK